jgi:hypothetical protein
VKKCVIGGIVVVAILVVAITILRFTVPSQSNGVRFPLTPAQSELLASVPASAQSFALIPSAAAVYTKLRENPITRDAVEQWSEQQRLPQPWMLGGADVVIWNSGEGASYAIRLDSLRALLVRMYLMIGADIDGRWSGTTFLINAPVETAIDPAATSRLLALASGLPAGDILGVQRESGRSAFPPINRPAVTSIQISGDAINLTSRAPNESTAPAAALQARYARSALLTAVFAAPPRMFDDLNRLLLTRISPLVRDGGGITLYDIDTGTLLPRPKGVIFLPPSDERRQELQRLVRDSGGLVQTGEQNGELLLSFDVSSLGRYAADSFDAPRWPANEWSLRLDAQRAAPILKRLGGSMGLRLAAPRIYRAARDLGTWIGPLEHARSVDAAASANGGIEELRVAITSK